ncbi:unnamed protein product [Polarella glacialis]|uniref:Uncharacterized protein n=1 Tax=Polarella glacialis TaxID=89957 RepID=A0A813GS49_POLGL|nr:unnamed protein product [Polarella glacialis]
MQGNEGFYMNGGVTPDDELAQTRVQGSESLGATLDKADRILAAARELDRKLVTQAFEDAKVPAFYAVLEEAPESPGQETEVQRLRKALADAERIVQEESRRRAAMESQLSISRAALQLERDRALALEGKLHEERQGFSAERARLLRLCQELEELGHQSTPGSGRDPAGPGGTHGEAATAGAQAPKQGTGDTWTEVSDIAERLDQTLSEIEERGRALLGRTVEAAETEGQVAEGKEL